MKIKIRALGALAGIFVVRRTVRHRRTPRTGLTPKGAVVNVSSIRTEPGKFEDYMEYLAGPYKQLMDEQKKAGHILDWSVYQTPRAAGRSGPLPADVYKNMAALDGLEDEERSDPARRSIGSDGQAAATPPCRARQAARRWSAAR